MASSSEEKKEYIGPAQFVIEKGSAKREENEMVSQGPSRGFAESMV